MWKKKKSRWFHNRPLSPVKINILQDVQLRAPYNYQDTDKEWSSSVPEIEENTLIDTVTKNKDLEDIDVIDQDFKKITVQENTSINTVTYSEGLQDIDKNRKSYNKAVNEEDTTFLCSKDVNTEDNTLANAENSKNQNEDVNHMPSSPSLLHCTYELLSSDEDPFACSDDEDSSYCPSDEEDMRHGSENSHSEEYLIETRSRKNIQSISESVLPLECTQNYTSSLDKRSWTVNSGKPMKKYNRKPDFCYFCESMVHNFARHVIRNHGNECDVAEIISKPVKSRDRRKLINLLRRKGNYLNTGGERKPVRQPYFPEQESLPCDHCLGIFTARSLYRHRRKCGDGNSRNAQTAGQTKLSHNTKVDEMRADKISLVAKSDFLVCAFGSRYLKTHRDKHFISITSRKMRELSRLLIVLKEKEPNITNLFEALQPQYFDLIVETTKIIARYDSEKEIFESPTLAMNMATSLKQCCDIVITNVIKRKETMPV